MSSQLINQIGSALAEAYELPNQTEEITSKVEKIVDEETRKRGPTLSLEQRVVLERELRRWKEQIPQERLESARLDGALNDLKFVLSYQHRGTTLKNVASWASDHIDASHSRHRSCLSSYSTSFLFQLLPTTWLNTGRSRLRLGENSRSIPSRHFSTCSASPIGTSIDLSALPGNIHC